MYKEIYKKKRKWSKFNAIIGMSATIGFVSVMNPIIVKADGIYGYGYYFDDEMLPKEKEIQFYLGEGYSSNAIGAIQGAIATINNVGLFEISLSFTSKSIALYDEFNTIGAELSETEWSRYGMPDAVMITLSHVSDEGEILTSDILVRESANWTNTTSSGRRDYQGAFTHELGHALGLKDMYGNYKYADYKNFIRWFTTDESLPTMYGYDTYKSSNKYVFYHLRSLESGDINGLKYIYKLIK